MSKRLEWTDLDTGTAQHLTRLTAHVKPIKADWTSTPDGLYDIVDPIAITGRVVWVHGSGHWRPAIVVRVSPRGVHTVVHSTPSSGVLYTKRVKLSELRTSELRLA